MQEAQASLLFLFQYRLSSSPYKNLINAKYINIVGYTILFLTSTAHAKDFGVRGPVFAIEEENMVSHIISKLQKMESSGELKKHQEAMAKKAKEKLQRPTAVSGVSEAKESKSWLYDPSITIQKDITDHKGQIIANAGTTINPLDKVSFGKPLLLVDGDNEKHLKWAGEDQGSILVLVKGSPFELMEHSDRRVFFDQAGSICRRFSVKHVPARISQKDKALLIEEIALEEGR
ncbi:type-F conjugative transfer system protein TraW [Alphaproteobacteria bacterium]|nr:type-F conjugative transfer system protein TraW [Alphaproteobacteria bacterium]